MTLTPIGEQVIQCSRHIYADNTCDLNYATYPSSLQGPYIIEDQRTVKNFRPLAKAVFFTHMRNAYTSSEVKSACFRSYAGTAQHLRILGATDSKIRATV